MPFGKMCRTKGAGAGRYVGVVLGSLFSLWGFDDSGRGRRGQKGVVVVDVLVPLRNLGKARTANGAGVGGRRLVGVRTFLRPLRLALEKHAIIGFATNFQNSTISIEFISKH